MAGSGLEERVLETKDWATVLFVLCFLLVAVTRAAFENRFIEFSRLAFSDKYIKIYRDGGVAGWFNAMLFFVQVISFAFLILLILASTGYAEKTDWLLFIRLATFTGVFILAKYLLEKIVATAFDIEDFMEQFNLQKISYRTYLGIILLPVNIFLYYHSALSVYTLYAVIGIILIINLLTYLNSLKIYQNLILSHLFYFILYLCALEIAPYYFMYYWFTRR
jgi:hypothetical protein